MANGNFGRVSGRAFGTMKSIALWKTKEKTPVQHIGIGDALKKVLVKAYNNRVKFLVEDLVDKYQFNITKGNVFLYVKKAYPPVKNFEKHTKTYP